MRMKTGVIDKTAMRARSVSLLSAALLVAAIWLTGAAPAQADDLFDVQAELGAKAATLDDLTRQLNESQQAVAGLDEEIGGLLSEIDDRQATRAELQDRISSLAQVMYKEGDGFNFLAILTSSDSLSDMLERMEMRNKMLSEYADLSDAQKRASRELEVAYREISSEKDAQYALLASLESQRDELDAALSELRGRESQLTDAQRAALDEAAKASAQAAETVETSSQPAPAAAASEPREAPQTQPETGAAPDSAAVEDAAASRQEQPVQPEPEPEPEPEPATAASAASGWQSGLASAYGGSSDPSTPNPGSTATGAVCDDWSMGVAVPMAWGPQAYYGRAVEISYGGRSVVATVNDCGGLGGGARSLTRPATRGVQGPRRLHVQRMGRSRGPIPLPVGRASSGRIRPRCSQAVACPVGPTSPAAVAPPS